MKLLGLISDVLDANKLDLGAMTFNNAMTSSKQVVSEFIENYAVILQKDSIKFITTNIDDIEINTDKNRIDQVLRIFITNAIDFVSKTNPQIELCVKQDNNDIVFSIIDNGIGIAKENHEKLFNKFYQIDSSATRKHGGSGLGLSIADVIAVGLNGSLGIKSELSKGSEFFIRIPINPKILETKIK